MRSEPGWGLFLTTVVSHLPVLPTIYLFLRRRYVYETCISVFGLISSLLYHTCQSLNMVIFLDQHEWHHLDNIAVLSVIGMWFVFICTFKDPMIERSVKYTTLLISVIVEEKDPWDISYTAGSLFFFFSIPFCVYAFTRQLPKVDRRYFTLFILSALAAVPFFIAGLDDSQDPFRVYHGLWHLFGGFMSYFMWSMVRVPGSTAAYPRGSISVSPRDTFFIV